MSRTQNRIEDSAVQRAALYIRVSTEEQAMHGLSLTAQRETLTRYVAENGLRLVGAYVDEGITARKKYKNRAAFMRMLRDVEENKIDLILFIKLDRWFRSIADYYEVQKILDAHNVRHGRELRHHHSQWPPASQHQALHRPGRIRPHLGAHQVRF